MRTRKARITPAAPVGASRGRKALSLLLAVSLFILLPTASAAAQQKDAPIDQLREQIAALAKVDADAATPPDIRSTNRTFLDERRAQLLGMLKYKAEMVRNYLASVGSYLSAAEKQPFEKSLSDLESEIKRVEQVLGSGRQPRPATDAGATSAPATAEASAPTAPPRGPAPNAVAAPTTTGAMAATGTAATAATAPAQLSAAPGCYPDAPPLLIERAQDAARLIIRNKKPAAVFTQINPVLFLSIADAVSDEAEDLTDEEREFIDTIGRERAKAETRRTDKQVGASARAEGSTSAAEKPGFAELLGFAVEHGAIQQAVNGTTLTLSSSPYVIFLAGQDDTATTYQNYGYLSRLGVSASFNIDDEENPLTSARRQQLTEWSAKLRLSADLSARSRSAQRIWDTRIRSRVGQLPAQFQIGLMNIFNQSREMVAREEALQNDFGSAAFMSKVQEVLDAAPADQLTQITNLVLCQARTSIYEPTRAGALPLSTQLRSQIVTQTLPAIASALAERDAALTDFRNHLQALSERPALTFAYTNKREADTSDYSNFRLLYSQKTREGLNIVGNAGLSFYHRPDAALNQQRLRDFAATISLEGVLKRSPFLLERDDESRVTFAFTGRYQRMLENRGVAGKKADIAVGQLKIEVPFMAGMTLPFSVTYASATELIKEDHLRANFGFTLDTDKLLQIIRLGALRRQ
jgi:hypothetical protein